MRQHDRQRLRQLRLNLTEPMAELFGSDAFSPPEIAERIERIGVKKARLPLLATAMLGVLAGAFIGLGAMFATVVWSDANLGYAAGRVLGGVVFSLGLLLVVVAGAELFTGNNLLVMAWADRRITLRELLRNWIVVLLANAAGAAGLAVLVWLSGHPAGANGAIGAKYAALAAAKCQLSTATAFWSGVLCNVLVCLAVWMASAGRSVVDKAVAIVFPVSAFVACGFEHSIANFYVLTLGLLVRGPESSELAAAITLSGALHNLVPVLLGNLLGGSGFVALVYHVIYRRSLPSERK